MKLSWRDPLFVLALILLWRVVLFIFTAQPIPSNDAFLFDGGVIQWLKHGNYVNPSLQQAFPISSGRVFSLYPPIYQGVLLLWLLGFGAGTLSVIAMHLAMFVVSALIVVLIVRQFFPANPNYGLAVALLLVFTFNDRPEDLAHIFGLASLWLVARQIDRRQSGLALAGGLAVVLLLALYTSVIVGAVYFGAGILASAAAWWHQRRNVLLVPYIACAFMFCVILLWVIEVHPLWWQGFLENSHKTPAVAGFRIPHLVEIMKLIRAVPVFLLAVAVSPWLIARRKELVPETWMYLVGGVFLMGLITSFLSMIVLSPNYVGYVLYLQIILAAGLLALASRLFPQAIWQPRILILVCVLLVSVRAVGMSTWGVVCAEKNSYWRTHEELRTEMAPFVKSNAPVVVSSAFLYSAAEFGVRRPIHSDWFYDRALTAADADYQAMITLRPPRLVLTQFDYYRGFVPLLDELRQHPELVSVQVRDFSAVKTPDSIPSLQRVVQHISWAPVVVDLQWKTPDHAGP